jgi:hypothetical protein
MIRMRNLVVILVLLLPSAVWAQQGGNATAEIPSMANATVEAPEKTDAAEAGLVTPVTVEHEGEDGRGSVLALALEERLADSPLFHLSRDDEPKLIIRISSRDEFSGRPGLASVYAVVWIYRESSDVLGHYLGMRPGVTGGEAEATAESLAARSHDLAKEFGYLFPER